MGTDALCRHSTKVNSATDMYLSLHISIKIKTTSEYNYPIKVPIGKHNIAKVRCRIIKALCKI